MSKIIGIDLGTTNSAFAYMVAGKPEIITNAEGDHLDHYGTIARYRAAFESFAGQAQQAIVLCGDDEGAREVYNHLPQDAVDRTVVYATTPFDELSPLMPALDASRFAFVGSPAEIPVSDDSRLRELEDATAAAMSSGSSVIVDEGVQETFALAMPAALLNGGAPYLRRDAAYPNIDGAFEGVGAMTLADHVARCKVVADLHEKVAKAEMVKCELLTEDGSVQRTTFADGTTVTVDFAKQTYEIQ